MSDRFGTIVIGSGFGGAVNACRAAEAGASVLVLERGRRWSPTTYPRGAKDPWLFDADCPQRKDGWLDVRLFKGMTVAQGAGVGGGSLCYSSVVMEPDADIFDDGWPPEINFEELKPRYETVARMLRVRTIPTGQQTVRHKLLQEAAEKSGYGERFFDAPLAVSFDEDYSYDLPDPIDKKHTKAFLNDQGRWQGTCVHLGNCDIGCDVQAKNTLDLNYIAQAERSGAEVRPSHLVRCIHRDGSGYRVEFDRIQAGQLIRGSERAERVIIAAGSLGSTELLLRCRDEFRTLPEVSQALGKRWSANGNFLTPASYDDPDRVRQGIGPTIAAAVNLMDGAIDNRRIIIEDDGFPNLLLNALNDLASTSWLSTTGWSLRGFKRRDLDEKNPLAHVMIWLGAGIDGGDGRLRLRRRWHAPWSRKLSLDWRLKESHKTIEAILRVHRELTDATHGRLHVPAFWRWLRALVTVHPLGGCALGTTSETGVVDHRCEVFGYPNLYVCDGAIMPRPIGRNPSMTIAALAERSADLMKTA